MLGAIDIDWSALWHTVVIAFAAGLVGILAAGSVIFSVDRAEGVRAEGLRRGRAAAGPWYAAALVGAVVVVGVVGLGIWAITQK